MISKFAVAAVAAVFAGGASAGLAIDNTPAVPAQIADATLTTPIDRIANPESSFRDVAVQFNSGKTFAHVVGVTTDGAGHAVRIRVALDDMPTQQLWLDQSDLVYSRSHDVIIAHDVHAPAMAVADAR